MEHGHRGGYGHPPGEKIKELLTLLEIPATQRQIGQKDIESLAGKLRSIRLAVPGAVACLFQIQRPLTQGKWIVHGRRHPFVSLLRIGGCSRYR